MGETAAMVVVVSRFLLGARDELYPDLYPVPLARLEGPSDEQVRLPRGAVVDGLFELEIPLPRLLSYGTRGTRSGYAPAIPPPAHDP